MGEIAVAMGKLDTKAANKRLGLKDSEGEELPETRDAANSIFEMGTANPLNAVANDDELKKAEAVIKEQAEEIAHLKKAAGSAAINKKSGLKHKSSMKKKKSAGAMQVDSSSMADWTEAVSAKSGKTYYYNKKTKETRWTDPNLEFGLDSDSPTKSEDAHSMFKANSFKRKKESAIDVKESRGSGFQVGNPMALAHAPKDGAEQTHAL